LIVPLNPLANQISAIQVAGTNVLVTLPSVAAEMYQLQYRTSLTAGARANVEGQVTSISGSLTVTNFGGFRNHSSFTGSPSRRNYGRRNHSLLRFVPRRWRELFDPTDLGCWQAREQIFQVIERIDSLPPTTAQQCVNNCTAFPGFGMPEK